MRTKHPADSIGGSLRRRAIGRYAGAALAAASMAGMLGVGGLAEPAGATTTFTVVPTADEGLTTPGDTACDTPDGVCSLREAIEAADNLGGTSTIDVTPGSYVLSLSQVLSVGATAGSNISIVGLGSPGDTTIEQLQPLGCTAGGTTGCQQVFAVDSLGAGGITFSLSNVTVTGGATSATTTPFDNGAGISAGGSGDSTNLTNDAITSNTVVGTSQNSPGGGISQQGGDLSVTGCTFSNDSAGNSSGGAIDFESTDGNADTLAVTTSTFSNDSSANPSGGGGAIYIDNSSPPGTVSATLTRSTFSQDSSAGGTSIAAGGGAVLVESGTLDAYSDNFLSNSASASGVGGAVNIVSGTTSSLAGDRLVDNSPGSTLATDSPNGASLTANDNWWAANSGPGVDDLTTGVTASTYLQLRVSVSVNPVLSANTTVVTADLTHDQTDAPYTTHFIPDGTPVTFGGTAGSYLDTSSTTSNGTATNSMTAGAGGLYPQGASATVDGQTASTSVTVDEAPSITSTNATTFNVGSAGSFTVAAGGYPPPSLSDGGAPLPTGVTFADNGNGTATLAGTPAAGTGGTYTFTITASNGVGSDATQSFTLTVDEAPGITSADQTTFTVGASGTFQVTTSSSFPTPPALSDGGGPLPTGVTFTDNGDGTATLAGTPATGTGGTYTFTITASNGVSPDTTQSFTLTVDETLSITSADATTFTAGSAGSFTVVTDGFPTAALSDGGAPLPSGVTFTDNENGTATLAGTPAAGTGGTYTFTITAANGVTPDATQSFTLTVDEAPSITSADAATFTVGSNGSFTVTTGHSFPASPAISDGGAALPTGVTFTDNGNGTATLAGTPAAGTGGTYTFTVTAANGVTPDATQSFTLTVDEAPSITSADAATFTVGSNGSFTVTTGHSFPASPALSDGGATLPSGVTFTDNGDGTATLAGTPAAGTGGTYTFTITAANGVTPDATQSFTLTVDEAPSITSTNATTFNVGSAGSFTVTAGGFPAPALSDGGATLPSGVTFTDNENGTATLAGTPAVGTGGTYSFTITASNGVGSDATQSFTLTVDEGPGITSADAATFTVGSSGSFTVTTSSSFPTPPALSDGGGPLPSGVTFTDNGDGTATLAGTPAAGTGGTYTFTITAANGVTPDATQSFTLTVDEAPSITSADAATFTVGSNGSFTVTTGHSFPASPALTDGGATLPSGVTFTDNENGTATLAGSPAAGTGGTYTFTITAANGVTPHATQSFTLTVDEAPSITSAGHATFTVGSNGSFTVTTGHSFPASPAISDGGAALPTGVTFTDNGNGTATLAGTPAAGTGGTYTFTITAANGVTPDATQSFTLTVDEAPSITSGGHATFTVGSNGSFTVTTGHSFPASPALSDGGATLPTGVTFTDNGNGTATLAGTPATGTGGTYSFTITAANGVTPDATQSFTLTVDEAPGITSAAKADAAVDQPLTFTVTTSGFPAPSLSEGGATLPTGITFTDNGNGTATLSGTPAAGTAGVYPFTITATNSTAPHAAEAFTLTVYDKLTALAGPFPPGTTGVPYTGQLQAVGGKAPYSWSLGAGPLPAGLSLDASTGVVAGTPTAGGTFLVTFTVTDIRGVTASVSVTIRVFPPGLRLAGADGGVFALGGAAFFGSLAGSPLAKPIVGMAPTPDGLGYWLVAADGGVFGFGDASYLGSLPGVGVHTSAIVGMAPTPDGDGYWLVGSDGGVYAFGDARFAGSLPGLGVHVGDVVGIAVTADGGGYWLVGSDGGAYAFGDASFHGSMGGRHLNLPMVGIVATADGMGYWLVAADGGVFAFGDAPFLGSAGGTNLTGVAGIVPTPDGAGYWLFSAAGLVQSYGDAPSEPGLSGPLAAPIVGGTPND